MEGPYRAMPADTTLEWLLQDAKRQGASRYKELEIAYSRIFCVHHLAFSLRAPPPEKFVSPLMDAGYSLMSYSVPDMDNESTWRSYVAKDGRVVERHVVSSFCAIPFAPDPDEQEEIRGFESIEQSLQRQRDCAYGRFYSQQGPWEIFVEKEGKTQHFSLREGTLLCAHRALRWKSLQKHLQTTFTTLLPLLDR